MSGTSLLPAPRLTTDLQPKLVELAERRMLSPAREVGYDLRLVGATVLPQRQVIARTQWGKWLFVSHFDDPTAKDYGGKIPIPAEQFKRLEELHRAGVRPDLVWLGHQLPDGWQEGEAVPVPAPAHLREKDKRLTQQLSFSTRLFVKGAAGLLAGAALAPLAAGAAVLGAAAGAGLDPIVLGGVQHPEAPVVQWVLLAQWEWQ
jgi:hypothetical protein